jgi:hypothetical protein
MTGDPNELVGNILAIAAVIVLFALVIWAFFEAFRETFRERGFFEAFRKQRTKPQVYTDSQVTEDQSVSIVGGPKAPAVTPRRAIHSIFISYRRNDSSDVTGRIYDRLVQHFGSENIFRDIDSIPLGVDFRKHLADSVGQCHLLLVVIGKNWLTTDETNQRRNLGDPRDFVRIEVESACQRDIPIIPLLVQGMTMPREEELPPSLQSLAYHNAISIRSDPDFHQDVERLIRGIEIHLHEKGREA